MPDREDTQPTTVPPTPLPVEPPDARTPPSWQHRAGAAWIGLQIIAGIWQLASAIVLSWPRIDGSTVVLIGIAVPIMAALGYAGLGVLRGQRRSATLAFVIELVLLCLAVGLGLLVFVGVWWFAGWSYYGSAGFFEMTQTREDLLRVTGRSALWIQGIFLPPVVLLWPRRERAQIASQAP